MTISSIQDTLWVGASQIGTDPFYQTRKARYPNKDIPRREKFSPVSDPVLFRYYGNPHICYPGNNARQIVNELQNHHLNRRFSKVWCTHVIST